MKANTSRPYSINPKLGIVAPVLLWGRITSHDCGSQRGNIVNPAAAQKLTQRQIRKPRRCHRGSGETQVPDDRLSTFWPELSKGHPTTPLRSVTRRARSDRVPPEECPQLEQQTGDRPGFAAVAGALGNNLGAASRDPGCTRDADFVVAGRAAIKRKPRRRQRGSVLGASGRARVATTWP
jgi:hypothetical protein